MEEWRPVVGYEGKYSVSSLGRVRSNRWETPGLPTRKPGVTRTHVTPGKLLAPGLGSNGYLLVSLYLNGKLTTHPLHHVVAAAFLGPKPAGLNVLHDDDVRTNNVASNLYYGTQAQNIHDISRNGNRRVTQDDVRHIRTQREAGVSLGVLAKQYGVSNDYIGLITRRVMYAYVE